MSSNLVKKAGSSGRLLACTAGAVLLTIVVIAKLGTGLAQLSEVRRAVAVAFTMTGKDPNEAKGPAAAAKGVADALKKKNLFAKQPPKEHPIKQIDGILGNEALIQNKWYKTGDKVGDARIVSIGATGVLVDWDGKKTTISPIAAAMSESGPPRPELAKSKSSEPNKPAKKADANEVKVVAKPKTDDPLAFMGTSLSERVRGILLQLWDKVPDDQKEKAKEDWSKMSDAEKQKALQAMENMSDEQVQQMIQSKGAR
jgi:hypothetical protein